MRSRGLLSEKTAEAHIVLSFFLSALSHFLVVFFELASLAIDDLNLFYVVTLEMFI